MVVCKFFLQGTCKFGDNCKFEHQINPDHSYTNSSILVQNYASKPQTASNVDTNALIKAVVNDMTAAEKGGQWLLSSYAPFKEKPAFPGFEDHSMEEIRYLFHESVKNGSFEQYKQNLQMMLQQAMMKIKALQNPSPEAISVLKNIYDTPPSNSVFGGSKPQPQQPVFANTNQNIFGGGGGGANPQQSVFTGPNTNSIFGGQNSPNSIFGGNTNNQNKSIFGGAQPTAPTNNSIFGNGPSNSIFGPQQTVFQQQSPPFAPNQQQQSLFNQNTVPPTNIFQQNQFPTGPAVNQSAFSPPQNNNVFAPSQNNPMFTQNPQFVNPQVTVPTPQNKPAFQHTQSIFGNAGIQQPNVFGGTLLQPKPTEEFYSKLEDLTPEEIKWFESDDLDISKIPEKPPTYEMCFKVP